LKNQFIGIKIVSATPITRGDYNLLRGWELPADENGEDLGMLKDDGEGHIQWDPIETFDRDFKACIGMPFGMAVEAMKKGLKVARAGWNGAGMFAYLVPANSYPAQTGAAKSFFGEKAMVPYREYMVLKTAQGDVATWAPSGSDALADDWMIVE
jgi:hypothetical protein